MNSLTLPERLRLIWFEAALNRWPQHPLDLAAAE